MPARRLARWRRRHPPPRLRRTRRNTYRLPRRMRAWKNRASRNLLLACLALLTVTQNAVFHAACAHAAHRIRLKMTPVSVIQLPHAFWNTACTNLHANGSPADRDHDVNDSSSEAGTHMPDAGAAAAIAAAFVRARRDGEALGAFPGTIPPTLEHAYRCQDRAIRAWPDTIAGWKVGYIAPAQREP